MSDASGDEASNENVAGREIKSAIVVIGNEILSGKTKDTNTPWISERLQERGIMLGEVRVIQDVEESIVTTINELRPRFDYIFTTGGIGPTHDDITAQSIAKAFGTKLERNKEAFDILEEHYGLEALTPPRAKMSMIPAGASLIPNPVTAAPGFIIENVIVMAGVPRIMQAMLDHIMKQIQTSDPILSNTVTCSLAESLVANQLGSVQQDFPGVQLGSYPHYRAGVLGLSLVARGSDQSRVAAATQRIVELIEEEGGKPRLLSIETDEHPVLANQSED